MKRTPACLSLLILTALCGASARAETPEPAPAADAELAEAPPRVTAKAGTRFYTCFNVFKDGDPPTLYADTNFSLKVSVNGTVIYSESASTDANGEYRSEGTLADDITVTEADLKLTNNATGETVKRKVGLQITTAGVGIDNGVPNFKR